MGYWFPAKCKVDGMRVSASKSESIVLSCKTVECPTPGQGQIAPLNGGVWVSAVMRLLYWPVEVQSEQSVKALSIYWWIYIPTFNYYHELWAEIMITSSRNKLPLRGGSALRDRMKESGHSSYLLHIERTSWVGSGIWSGCLLGAS